MRIADFMEKCKSDRIFIPALIILVGIGSFGLGRLSKIESNKRGFSIEAPANVAQIIKNKNLLLNADPNNKQTEKTLSNEQIDQKSIGKTGEVVASKTGTKYHFPWCSGARTIAEKNKIWFNSAEEARKAGYQPASNCKGLN
jgi:hypothetical protein